jgi:epoxyqueuosine reductase QueG
MSAINKQTIKDKILELYNTELELLPKEYGGVPVFDIPDVRIASANDHVIKELKNVIGDFHWSPQEALEKTFNSTEKAVPEAEAVISWCLPASEEARKSNRKEDYYPSREWAWTRTYGENMSDRMKVKLSAWLTELGYPTTAPGLLPDFGFIQESPVGIASQWSERHYAWAAGHGTFGISGGLITRRGIAHRLGSVVTSLPLEADIREYGDDPFAWCNNCGACIKRCPVGSIGKSNAERNKDLCDEHDMKRIAAQYGKRYNWEGIYGCGLCQTGVPCEFKRP